MNSKHWYQSKTIWFNILTLIASILAAIQAQYADVAAADVAAIATVAAVVNIILRSLTSAQIISPSQATSSPTDTAEPQ